MNADARAAYRLGQESARDYRRAVGRPRPLQRQSDIGEWLLNDLEQLRGRTFHAHELKTLAGAFLGGVASQV